ncbi:MAG TPA: ATP-binding protein [Bryobacteraceae bacterium]|nr:ATP-binding protein [Bryobacteraceae bacterium]
MGLVAGRKHITRGLRFTLTMGYTIVFTILLLGISLVFRQRLASSLDDQAHVDLNRNSTIVRGNLRLYHAPEEKYGYQPDWFLDPHDPEENRIKADVQNVEIVADANGNVLEESKAYQSLGADSVAHIRSVLNSNQPVWLERRDPKGVLYLIRQFWVESDDHKKFFVAIGLSLAHNQALLTQFTWVILGLIPLVILTGGLTGWVFAGRALSPVIEIAQAAQRITGSKLSLRIPSRGAGDELDYLIETFNQMIERLEINFNQVRQFSTDVSHELRTPITIIRGQLEVALFTAQTAEQYRDAIVNSLSDIERLSQIVRALLLLSQAETGQVALQKQSLDLVELTSETADQFQIPAEGADLKLTFSANCNKCLGYFDRVQIERMLSNLLSNAIKFTPAGGRVEVSLKREGNDAEIQVKDSGQGISPEHLPHIFDRFYRVRSSDSPEQGLGLGLSFVAWIARAHGGSVDVQSELGKGTTFRIALPLHASSGPEIAQESPSELMKQV